MTKTRGAMTNWPFVVFLPIAIAARKMTVEELIIVGVGSGLHIEPELGKFIRKLLGKENYCLKINFDLS